MIFDIFVERGFPFVDVKYGDEEICRFPLFDFLHPLPLEWMYIIYMILLIGKKVAFITIISYL